MDAAFLILIVGAVITGVMTLFALTDAPRNAQARLVIVLVILVVVIIAFGRADPLRP